MNTDYNPAKSFAANVRTMRFIGRYHGDSPAVIAESIRKEAAWWKRVFHLEEVEGQPIDQFVDTIIAEIPNG